MNYKIYINSSKILPCIQQEYFSGKTITWYPIEVFEKNNIGISENNLIVISKDNKVYELNNKHFRFLINILEEDIDAFNKKRNIINEQYGFDFIDIFPFKEIIKIVLNSYGDYWINLALDWITYFDYNDDWFKMKMKEIMINSKYSQKIRHKIKKLYYKS